MPCACNAITYAEWCEVHSDWSIANLDFGTIDYDKSSIAVIFDKYYAPFIVVDPRNDFAKELQLAYDLAKARIDQYYTAMGEFVPHEYTHMENNYGARHTNDKAYEYPIDGSTPSPNVSSDSNTDNAKDTTDITKDTDPFKHMVDLGGLRTFEEFFIEQFRDCFTLACGMTW